MRKALLAAPGHPHGWTVLRAILKKQKLRAFSRTALEDINIDSLEYMKIHAHNLNANMGWNTQTDRHLSQALPPATPCRRAWKQQNINKPRMASPMTPPTLHRWRHQQLRSRWQNFIIRPGLGRQRRCPGISDSVQHGGELRSEVLVL